MHVHNAPTNVVRVVHVAIRDALLHWDRKTSVLQLSPSLHIACILRTCFYEILILFFYSCMHSGASSNDGRSDIMMITLSLSFLPADLSIAGEISDMSPATIRCGCGVGFFEWHVIGALSNPGQLS